MTQKNKHIDDLNYLSQLGFEAVKVTESELDELQEKVRTKFGSAAQIKNYLYSMSIGLFIGITLFFAIYNTTSIYPSQTQTSTPLSVLSENKSISLDTVSITKKLKNESPAYKDKFIEPTEKSVSNLEQAENLMPIETEINSTSESNSSAIKYTPNASFIFLHDLKIANYHVYYFNAQQNISMNTGLPANYSSKEEQQLGSKKLDRNYYLHEAINDAMGLFKKQKFTDCLNLLNTINYFNSTDVNCQFYIGMCAYYQKNYNLAYEKLNLASNNPINVFAEESTYYLALTLQQLKRFEEANKMLLDISNSNGFYADKAKAVLNP